jgi:hypothetical protein
MTRRRFQISGRHRLALYAITPALFLSGLSWAWIHHLDQTGQATEGFRRMKPFLITIHGFGAMAFVLLFGTLLVGHVRRAWHARKNRNNGVFFLSSVAVLTLSGYALYYLSDENWRAAASKFHLWFGVVSPALLFWHIRSGRNSVNRD